MLRIVVQCASPLLRSVVVRHLVSDPGLTTVRLGDVAGTGRPADRADVLLQVLRRPTTRSMAAAGWATATGLPAVLLAEGHSLTATDLAEAARHGITAVLPLEAVTGELLRTTIFIAHRGGAAAPAAELATHFERLRRAAQEARADVRWVASRRR